MNDGMTLRGALALNTHKWKRGEHNMEGRTAATKFTLCVCTACGTKVHHYYDLFHHGPTESAWVLRAGVICDKATTEERDVAYSKYEAAEKEEQSKTLGEALKLVTSQTEVNGAGLFLSRKRSRTRTLSRSRSPSPLKVKQPRCDTTNLAVNEDIEGDATTRNSNDCVLPTSSDLDILTEKLPKQRAAAVLRFVRQQMQYGNWHKGHDTYKLVIDPNDPQFKAVHKGPLLKDTLTRAFGVWHYSEEEESEMVEKGVSLVANLSNWSISWQVLMHQSQYMMGPHAPPELSSIFWPDDQPILFPVVVTLTPKIPVLADEE